MTDLADPPLRSAVDKFVTPNATQSQSQVTSIWSVWFNSLATYIKSLSGGKWGATAGGTANALTIATSPPSTEYTVGRVFRFKSGASANTGATTLNIDGIGTIAVQVNGAACSGGEIQPNQFYEVLIDTVSTCQLLLIGKTASATITTVPSKLPSIDCTQAGGALTFSGAAQYWDFHNVSLTNGTPATINAAPANLILPSGGTLGGVSGQNTRIIRVIMNNAGVGEYAICNQAGGLDMSETGLISTTAIGAGSTANNVWYSTTARTNLAYRIDSAYDVVNTAGAWASPTTKINAGGNSLTAMSSLGYGQTLQTVTRNVGTTYYNVTGKPITVSIGCVLPTNGNITPIVNGYTLPYISNGNTGAQNFTYTFIVPVGGSYSSSGNTATQLASELR